MLFLNCQVMLKRFVSLSEYLCILIFIYVGVAVVAAAIVAAIVAIAAAVVLCFPKV